MVCTNTCQATSKTADRSPDGINDHNVFHDTFTSRPEPGTRFPSSYLYTPCPALRPKCPAATIFMMRGHGRNFSPSVEWRYFKTDSLVSHPVRSPNSKIGRASCRERV